MKLVFGIARIIRWILKAVIISFVIVIVVGCSTVVGMFKIAQWIPLHEYRQEIYQWDVPPETELRRIKFEVVGITNGNDCDTKVILTLHSTLSIEAIYQFYMDNPQVDWSKEGYFYVPGMKVEQGAKPNEIIVEAIKFMGLPCLR